MIIDCGFIGIIWFAQGVGGINVAPSTPVTTGGGAKQVNQGPPQVPSTAKLGHTPPRAQKDEHRSREEACEAAGNNKQQRQLLQVCPCVKQPSSGGKPNYWSRPPI